MIFLKALLMVVVGAFAAGIFVVPVVLPQDFAGTLVSGFYGLVFLFVPWITLWLVLTVVAVCFRRTSLVLRAAKVSWLAYGALGIGLGLVLGWIARSTMGPLTI